MWKHRRMSRMIQVRNVPDWLHEELVARAKRSQRTLTDYVQGLLEREAARPPAEEVFERLHRREPVTLGRPAAELIREERAEAGRD
jgi:hypothetical protein